MKSTLVYTFVYTLDEFSSQDARVSSSSGLEDSDTEYYVVMGEDKKYYIVEKSSYSRFDSRESKEEIKSESKRISVNSFSREDFEGDNIIENALKKALKNEDEKFFRDWTNNDQEE